MATLPTVDEEQLQCYLEDPLWTRERLQGELEVLDQKGEQLAMTLDAAGVPPGGEEVPEEWEDTAKEFFETASRVVTLREALDHKKKSLGQLKARLLK